MVELIDYSGEFDPEFSHDKFAKETLLKLLETYSEYIRKIDAFWYLTVMEKWGNDEAVECDIKVWEKAKLFELQAISSTLNIKGNDVAAFAKYMQACPWIAITEYTLEVINNNRAILTHITCPTLLALEKEGQGREERQCREIDSRFMHMMAHFFNPQIKVTPLKVPPRTDYSDICCQWEFKL
ncbi:MAG: hypothetical protein HQ553_00430 [Chloroflexi bacterium]|nr:hypothetical protein [Chloroflexota bacterium]